ncbi:hypothetical protein DIPPA_14286 [Diplonema papillatum]|nr:hypothetical protein DIPPA_14286 [Diplonema papillatum]|eukprot:gene7974-12243_t
MSQTMKLFALCIAATTFARALDLDDSAPADVEETGAPETEAPKTGAPETGAPETGAPETATPETPVPTSERVINIEVKLDFTLEQGAELTNATLKVALDKLYIELGKVLSFEEFTFVKACDADLCIFAFELESFDSLTERAANALQASPLWELTFNMATRMEAVVVESQVNKNADTIAKAVSPSAVLSSVKAAPVGQSEGDDDDDLSSSAIAGIVVGCVLFVTIVVAVGAYFAQSRGASTKEQATNEPTAPETDLA